MNLVEEGKWLIAITSFEATNSVFNIINENNSFALSTPRYRASRSGAEFIHKLQKFLELRSQNNIELHVKEVKTRGKQIKTGDKGYRLSDFDTQKNEILEELKNVEYNDLEVTVFRMELTDSEIEEILDVKDIPFKLKSNLTTNKTIKLTENSFF